MYDLLTNNSFLRWIKGDNSSPEEKRYWESWIEKNPDHLYQAKQAKDIITAFESEFKMPDPEIELNKLDQVIDQHEYQLSRSKNLSYKWILRDRIGQIAAGIILLIVILGSVYTSWNYSLEKDEPVMGEGTPVQEYSTAYGEKLTFRLSDGSQIILNGNSNLKFLSQAKRGINTEIWLKGEAYFNIVRLKDNQRRKFTVHTEDGSIQVLGTRFGVNNYGSGTQTVLEEGEISIRVKKGTSDTSLTDYLLKTGEMARFTANDGKITIKAVNTLIHTSWTEDKLFFQNSPIQEVASRIKNIFGKEVIVDKKLLNETISGSIKSDNLEVLTEALAEILNANISIQDQKLLIETEN